MDILNLPKEVMTGLPVIVPECEILEMFAAADINGDGEINLQEFSHMVQSSVHWYRDQIRGRGNNLTSLINFYFEDSIMGHVP